MVTRRGSFGGSLFLSVWCWLFLVLPAAAGMPAITWPDMPTYFTLSAFTRERLQAVSFFLVGILVIAAVVQRIWNYLARDFSSLPRLSYFKGLGLVLLWGLFSVLILTMISGARELMTPGAWQKKGLLYALAETPAPPDTMTVERYRGIERLRAALWRHAQQHGGQFPGKPEDLEETAAWHVPHPAGMSYVYVPGQAADAASKPLAYEPGLFGSQRLVLLANGEIQELTIDEIRQRLEGGAP